MAIPLDNLSLSQSRLESVLDTAVDGIVVIDDRGNILLYNKACEALFGYPASEVVGQNVKLIMPKRYAEQHDGFLNHYVTTGEKRIIGIGREVEGQHKSGHIFPVELSVGEAQTPDGRQFIGILRDISKKRQTEEQLSQLQTQLVHMARVSAMDEMGAVIAHELNQPLTAIMLYLQALSRSVEKASSGGLSDQEKNILQKAVNEASRAGGIIQRMRRFIERGEAQRKEIDLAALTDEAVDFASLGSRLRNIQLEVSHAENPLMAEVDAIEISQVLVNLVRNAIDALEENGGTIKVRTWAEEEQVFVEVSDNGHGISAKVLENLFDAFVTTKKKGMGIGLSIARNIARTHNGDLHAHNRPEGGAVFTLRLGRKGSPGDPRMT